MSKLDAILIPTEEVRKSRPYKDTKEAIKQLFRDILGDDDLLSASGANMVYWQKVGKNELRAKARKEIEKL